MRIALIGQEEPLYFGPFFRKIIEAKSSEIVCIVNVGNRGIGSHPKTFLEKIKNTYCLWRLFEPYAFLHNLLLTCYHHFLSFYGLLGTRYDHRSIQGMAQKKGIPLLHTKDINGEEFHKELEQYAPDIIINQSELLIQEKLLSLPTIGILNRHASLLPHFRGRVGSFWAHAEKVPTYGVTIHLVDKKIDSGPIVIQEQYHLDPTLSYAKILNTLFQLSVPLMLQALQRLEEPHFSCLPNHFKGTRIYGIPTLSQIQAYRRLLKTRRASKKKNNL